MTGPDLHGLPVVVTRPAGTGEALAARLREAGADVLTFPAIVIRPMTPGADDAALLRNPASFDHVVFVSPTTVRAFFASHDAPWPKDVTAVAPGAGTAESLRACNVSPVIQPANGAGSEAMLALPELAAPEGRRILILGGAGGRRLLYDTLRERGAAVTKVAIYRRDPPTTVRPLIDWLHRHPQARLLVTSKTALEHLHGLIGEPERATLLGATLVVPSQRVLNKAQSLGFLHTVCAADAGDDALIACLSAR